MASYNYSLHAFKHEPDSISASAIGKVCTALPHLGVFYGGFGNWWFIMYHCV